MNSILLFEKDDGKLYLNVHSNDLNCNIIKKDDINYFINCLTKEKLKDIKEISDSDMALVYKDFTLTINN